MPLRDHIHPPLHNLTSWDGFHGQWPAMIVLDLAGRLPQRYVAAPTIHFGASVEIDVATFQDENATGQSPSETDDNGNVATALWAPPAPTLVVEADLAALDVFEVRVYDSERGRRLVAAVEIVSPANKDRSEHRRAFVAKCAALLQENVSVMIVDLVTTRRFNLYADLLELIGHTDPALQPESPNLYAAACRNSKPDDAWLLEAWMQPLTLGQPLPTLPLWLADNLAIPLDLETSYEETCRVLRIA